jgi:hypothetical protein
MTRAVRAAQQARPVPQTRPVAPISPNLDNAQKAARLFLELAQWHLEQSDDAAHAGRTAFETKIYDQAVDSVFDPKRVADAIELAKSGDPDARMGIHLAIIGYMKIGQLIPEPLQEYLIELLCQQTTPGKRGRVPNKNFLRNAYIKQAVRAAMDYGFDRTRNREPKSKSDTFSACSIVADILREMDIRITERNVEEISKPE